MKYFKYIFIFLPQILYLLSVRSLSPSISSFSSIFSVLRHKLRYMSGPAPKNLVPKQIDPEETLASFMSMAKNKGKPVVTEPQKLQTLEENVQDIDQRFSDFMSEIYNSQQLTKAFVNQRLALFDQKFGQLIEKLQGDVRLNVLLLKGPSLLNPQM